MNARFSWVLVAALTATLLGVSNPVLAQDTGNDEVKTFTEADADRVWMDPADRVGQTVTIDLESVYRLSTYRNLRDLGRGRDRTVDSSTWGAKGDLSVLLNSTGVSEEKDDELRLAVHLEYWYTSDSDAFQREGLHGLSQLDQYTSGGQVGLIWQSTPGELNQRLRYRLEARTGALYHHWGRFYGTMWWSSAELDLALNVLTTGTFRFGPAGGFEGDLRVGEHQSNQLDGLVSVGFDGSAEKVAFSLRGVATGYLGDANSVTGNFAKVERQSVRLGARFSLLVAQTVEFTVMWTHPLYENYEVDLPSGSTSSTLKNEGTDLFEVSLRLRF